MNLYPKIDDYSILLDNDCKRMLRRSSRKLIICEVLEKLSDGNKKETLFIDTSNSNSNYNINKNKVNKLNILEFILNIFGCNIN